MRKIILNLIFGKRFLYPNIFLSLFSVKTIIFFIFLKKVLIFAKKYGIMCRYNKLITPKCQKSTKHIEEITMEIALGIILMVASVFLIVAVLMQSGKSHKLSGTIAGGAETFFGKTKGKAIDKLLSKLTTIIAICFVVLVAIIYIIQPKPNNDAKDDALDDALGSTEVETQK